MEEPIEIHPLLRQRRSSRSMDPNRPVSAGLIRQVLEAARWAPSSGNGQPWRYIVFDQRVPEALEQARAYLSPGNQTWARGAPTLILAIARQLRDDGTPNTKAEHDLGLANMCLLLQAVALGLHCRTMGGFDAQAARQAFHIPAGHVPLVMIAVGHPGDANALPPDLLEKESAPRRRKSLSDLAFLGAWDGPDAGDG
jgi:nitroreductase